MMVDDDGRTITVELSHEQMTTAAMVGVRRQLSAMAKQRQHWGILPSSETEAFDNHIVGAMAELAVARCFNLFWDDAVGSINGCDVGGLIEARARRINGFGLDLAMRPKDATEKPNKPFVLVHAAPPRFVLAGWLYGLEAWEAGQPNTKTGLRYVRGTIPPLRCMSALIWEIESRGGLA